MNDAELFDALDGMFAYDSGARDSGIHDEQLRARVKAELRKPEGLARLTMFAKRYMEPPYTLEDVACLIKWLSSNMDFDL